MDADTSHPTGPPHHGVPRGWRLCALSRVWAIAAAALGHALASSPLVQAITVRGISGDAACLINAIQTANGNGEANTITLAVGAYMLTKVDNTTDGPNGLPSITGTITIIGDSAATTVIERNPTLPPLTEPSFRIFHVAATGILALENLSVKGGSMDDVGEGAGIFTAGGTLTISQSIIAENTVVLNKGGAGIFNTSGTVTIMDSTLAGNVAASNGGGLYSEGGTVTIFKSTLADNDADVGGGLLLNGGTATVVDSTIAENSTSRGGGIFSTGMLTILSSTIANNGATHVGGGGVDNEGQLTVLNSTIAGNVAGLPGGGLNNGAGTVQLQNTLLARNTAYTDSGIGADCAGVVTSLGDNLLGDPTGCTMTLLAPDLTGDPGLDAFTDHGTPGNGHFPCCRRAQPSMRAMMPPTLRPTSWDSRGWVPAIAERLSFSPWR